MQGSKSSYFTKFNKRNRYEDDYYGGGGGNSKRHVDGNKLARQKANRQRNKNEQNQGY